MKQIILFSAVLLLILSTATRAQNIITTVAGGGSGTALGDGGPAVAAVLANPIAVAKDSHGNLYITDRENNRIRKVDTAGIICTYAGRNLAGYSGDNGPATDASLYEPYGIAVDKHDNVYFTDPASNVVRKIAPTGIITTFAGIDTAGYNGDSKPASTAKLNEPFGIATDKNGYVYIGDVGNGRIRRVDTMGIITTYAGTGFPGYSGDDSEATAARIVGPSGIAVDKSNNLYFTESGKHNVRKIDSTGIITTIAGTGVGGFNGDSLLATDTKLFFPAGIAVDSRGNVYIADGSNGRVRKINVADSSNIITTVAGTGAVPFNGDNISPTSANVPPCGITIDGDDNIYITDISNNRVRYIKNTVAVVNVNLPVDASYIYPNPNNGQCYIMQIGRQDEPITITVTDLYGKIIQSLRAITNNAILMQLDVPTGAYNVEIKNSRMNVVKKIVVQS